jgi:hypothetical protein
MLMFVMAGVSAQSGDDEIRISGSDAPKDYNDESDAPKDYSEEADAPKDHSEETDAPKDHDDDADKPADQLMRAKGNTPTRLRSSL